MDREKVNSQTDWLGAAYLNAGEEKRRLVSLPIRNRGGRNLGAQTYHTTPDGHYSRGGGGGESARLSGRGI